MRLSQWPKRAPHKDAMSAKVSAVIVPVVSALGADADPSCWIVWGDDPAVRYTLLVPTAAGLLQVHVRVNVPQEGPRVAGKLIRWSRVQTGELSLEMAGGHRFLSFQVEGLVIRGSDEEAVEIAAFALEIFAAIDGRAVVSGGTSTDAAAQGVTPPATAGRQASAARPEAEVRRLPAPRDPSH